MNRLRPILFRHHHVSDYEFQVCGPLRDFERFGKAIVTASPQHRVLRAQRAVHYFERGAHVVVEAAHHTGANFAPDVEVRAASVAEVIEYGRQRVDDRLVGLHLAIEHAQRIRFRAALAIDAQ